MRNSTTETGFKTEPDTRSARRLTYVEHVAENRAKNVLFMLSSTISYAQEACLLAGQATLASASDNTGVGEGHDQN